MKKFSLLLLAGLAMGISPAQGGEHEIDPLSVVQALMDAERATDLPLAVSMFAAEGTIVNVAGARFDGAALRRFLETDMWMHDDFVMNDVVVQHDRVSWTRSITAEFYEKLGVAPVRFAFAARIAGGKIRLIVAHVPRAEIARIEKGCLSASESLLYGRPCEEFVGFIKDQADATTAMLEDSEPLARSRSSR